MNTEIFSWCDHEPLVPDASASRQLLDLDRLFSNYERFAECGETLFDSQLEHFDAEQPTLIRLMAALADRLTPEANCWQAVLGLSIWQCFREQFPNSRKAGDSEVELLGKELMQKFVRPAVCLCDYHQSKAMHFASRIVADMVNRGELSAAEGVVITHTAVQLIETLDRASATPLPNASDQ